MAESRLYGATPNARVTKLPIRVEISVRVVVPLLDDRVAIELKIRDFSRLHQTRPKHGRRAKVDQPVQRTNLSKWRNKNQGGSEDVPMDLKLWFDHGVWEKNRLKRCRGKFSYPHLGGSIRQRYGQSLLIGQPQHFCRQNTARWQPAAFDLSLV